MTLDQEIAIDDWIMRDFDPDKLHVIQDREEEPQWHDVLTKAKERAEQGDEMIRTLLAIIQHYDNTLDSYFWNMSDNGDLPHGA